MHNQAAIRAPRAACGSTDAAAEAVAHESDELQIVLVLASSVAMRPGNI